MFVCVYSPEIGSSTVVNLFFDRRGGRSVLFPRVGFTIILVMVGGWLVGSPVFIFVIVLRFLLLLCFRCGSGLNHYGCIRATGGGTTKVTCVPRLSFMSIW